MQDAVLIGIIGDFDGRFSHVATNEAIAHAAAALALPAQVEWLPTVQLAGADGQARLGRCDGIWASPGSPYQNIDGALAGIRFARERNRPFVGT